MTGHSFSSTFVVRGGVPSETTNRWDILVGGWSARYERMEIVPADAALYFWKFPGDLGGFARAELQHVAKQTKAAIARIHLRKIARHFAEMQQGAVGKGGVHRARVVAHGAVAQRTPAAGIVARHAADGGARGGGNSDRKPQAMLFELPVEIVEHDPRFDHAGTILNVERDDAVQVFREIYDDAVIDGLAALRSPAAARRDDPAVVPGDGEHLQRFVHGSGDHDAERHDLVKRSVGRIAAAAKGVEKNVAGGIRPEPLFKPREA